MDNINHILESLSSDEIQQLVTKLWNADTDRKKLDLNFQTKLGRDDNNDKSPEK